MPVTRLLEKWSGQLEKVTIVPLNQKAVLAQGR